MLKQEVREVTAQEPIEATPKNWLPSLNHVGMLIAFANIGYKPYEGTVPKKEKESRRAANKAAHRARRFNR